MPVDLFEKITKKRGALGQYAQVAKGYYMFPELKGFPGPRMLFNGKECIVWSLNNYLGLANHPFIRRIDAETSAKYGLGNPMGARMLTGETENHKKLEQIIANLLEKEDAMLFNYGYQGLFSTINALLSREDIVIYDSECHACIIDGILLHKGYHYSYKHNDINHLEDRLKNATKVAQKTKGGILVITEGVFGMQGDMGKIDEIVSLKDKYNFRLLVDDAHGIGVMGPNGKGVCHHLNVANKVDLIFGTFAKAFASIGAFIAGNKNIIEYLRYNNRSQIFSKSLPLPIVISNYYRVKISIETPELREKLFAIATSLKNGLKKNGFDLGKSNTPITPVFLKGTPFQAANLVADLRENKNVFCSMVIYPVVPKNTILLRLIPTAAHSQEDVEITIEAFTYVKEKLEKNLYPSEKLIIMESDLSLAT